MITFKLSFLLAFPLTKPRRTSLKYGSKTQQEYRNGNGSSLATPISSVHINYELIPGRCKCDLDLICWGNMSKIISKEGQIMMKTIIRDDKVWVPFSIDHNLGNLKLEEVKKYRDYVVKINITSNDNLNSFSTFPVYDIDPGDSFYEIIDDFDRSNEARFREDSLKNYLRLMILRMANYTSNEVVTWLHGPDNYRRFYEILDLECSGKVYPSRNLTRPSKTSRESVNQTVSFNTRTSKYQPKASHSLVKRVDSNDVLMIIPAEIFFTDPNFTIHRQESSNGVVNKAFVMITVESLITKAQKLVLNSFVIKVIKLVNIPVDSLRKYGVQSIFFNYEIPSIASYKSSPKSLDENIRFDEGHIYFTDKVEKLKLIEFLQSQRLFVEIYGNRVEIPEEQSYSLFGEESNDYEISKIQNCIEETSLALPNPILLAVAAYDVSSSLDNVWDFRELGQCHLPTASCFQKPYVGYDVLHFCDVKTANEVNLSPPNYLTYPCILEESTLLTLGTSLEIEAFLMAPQAASLILHQIPNTFKRILIVFHDEELAQQLYNEINDNNAAVLEEVRKDSGQKNPELQDIVTGFLLDNGNDFAFFVEGPSNGFILNAWHIVGECSPNQARVFFNTEKAFERRLYSQFLGQGIFPITLKIPLHEILANYKLYLKQNVPIPCMEALKKFSLLFNSASFKTILQQNLLPGPRELISLDLEWGVPMRWKKSSAVDIHSTIF